MHENIKKIRDALCSEPSVVLAYLFGSRAKGVGGSRSDWDIAVYFTESALNADPWHDFVIGGELSRIVSAEVQIIVLNRPMSPLLGFEILKKGDLLVSRDDDLRLDYENRILRAYYDWSSRRIAG